MIYALQATLTFTTTARRDTFVSAIQNRIATKPRWGATTVQSNGLTVNVELRFTLLADLDDLYTFCQQRASQQQGKGRISRHNCRHDEPNPGPCTVDAEAVL